MKYIIYKQAREETQRIIRGGAEIKGFLGF